MNKEKLKGTIDDAAGRVQRQVGEWTGNPKTQAQGAARQIKGKAEKAAGEIEDALRDDRERKHDSERTDHQKHHS